MLPDRTDELVGSMLGREYRVLELIGAGEMAAVYLVEHQASRQRFAAKVLSRARAVSAEACARFTQGARAAARLVERSLTSLRTCYRTAARAGGATPAVDLRLTFEIDENSLATQIATSGAGFGSLATCAAGVASQIRTQEAPDVGTVQVAVVIRFRPS